MLSIPTFWYKDKRHSWQALSLMPVGLLYGKITATRANKLNGYKSKLPVICVGNITMGGTGKTPTSLALAKILQNEFGKNIAFLTRGYGGSLKEPTKVGKNHTASQCGDEPLLLSHIAPTYVSPDRGKGAILIEQENEHLHDHALKTHIIILDDGMQNPTLQKDMTLVIIDGKFGLGNNRLCPAGPLRETLTSAQHRSSAFIIIGEDQSNTADLIHKTIENPLIIQAHIMPKSESMNESVIVFAGIGMPEKVFNTAKQAGYNIIATKSYGDHYKYQSSDLDQLAHMSINNNAKLLTTSKDYARLPQEFISKHNPLVLEIELTFPKENKEKLINLLHTII